MTEDLMFGLSPKLGQRFQAWDVEFLLHRTNGSDGTASLAVELDRLPEAYMLSRSSRPYMVL